MTQSGIELDTLALEGGMLPAHAKRLIQFCSERIYRRQRLLIIVRGCNRGSEDPASLDWWDQIAAGLARPKHAGIKQKTDPRHGRIIHGGKLYYSDYDLQCVFSDQGRFFAPLFTGNFVKTDDGVIGEPGLNEFLRVLNQYVCGAGKPKMFIHGAQDDYRIGDKPLLMPKRTEKFLVFEPAGSMQLIQGSRRLMEFYNTHGLPWRYGNPQTH